MYLYPWDLRTEGTALVLDRLRDCGMDSLTVAAAYHSGKFLRPHATRQKVYFPEGGTVYFRPDPTRYERLQPKLAEEAQGFDAFAELGRHAPDMPVTAWVVGLHNTRLGQAHPDLAAQTPYGDPLYNSLCPSRPEVRHYLAALCGDAAGQPGVSEIALETPGWQAFRHGHHHEFELIDLPDRVQTLLGMCFCAACRDSAARHGLDPDRLARTTVGELDGFFETGALPATDPGEDPEWRAFHAWRAGSVADLVREVRAGLPEGIRLAVIPTALSPNDRSWREGSDLSLLAAAADRLEVPAYCNGVESILRDAAWVREKAGASADLGFILRPSYPNLTGADQVRDAVSGLLELHPSSVNFYNYGHFRLESLDWIGAALSD